MESINTESINTESINNNYKNIEIHTPVSINTTILSLLTNPIYLNKMTKTIKDSDRYSTDVITFYKKRTNTLFKDLYQTNDDIPSDIVMLHKQFTQLSIKYFIIKDNELTDSIINAQKVMDSSQNDIQIEIPIPQLKIINTISVEPSSSLSSLCSSLNNPKKTKKSTKSTKSTKSKNNSCVVDFELIEIVRSDTSNLTK